MKRIRGIGLSDSPDYAERLAGIFDYRNTWYHREPRFDVTSPDSAEFGRYDFVIASEVLEHVGPPVERAFENLHRVLKPNGILVLTVPYRLEGATQEHFPALHDWSLARLRDAFILVNRTVEGRIEVHENLVFHGGPGSTLEVRVFSQAGLEQTGLAGGFSGCEIYSEDVPQFGIEHEHRWSLPAVFRKGHYSLPHDCITELMMQWRDYRDHPGAGTRAELDALLAERTERCAALDAELAARTEWAQKLDGEITIAAARIEELETEVRRRTEWAQSLDSLLAERTNWALSLERELSEHVTVAARLSDEGEYLKSQLATARTEIDRLQQSLLFRLSRRLRQR